MVLQERLVLAFRVAICSGNSGDMGNDIVNLFRAWLLRDGVVESCLDGGPVFGSGRPKVEPKLIAEFGIRLVCDKYHT